MSTLVDELLGRNAALARGDLPGTKRTHVMADDDEDSPASLRKRILEALKAEPGLTRKDLVAQLHEDDDSIVSALNMLRAAHRIVNAGGQGTRSGYSLALDGAPREAAILPFVAGAANGEVLEPKTRVRRTTMPKGIYPRKPNAAGEGGGEASTTKSKRAKRKARIARPGKAAARPGMKGNGDACFIVDDAGSVSIVLREQRIDLTAGESTRLHSFLERTKGFRE